MAQMLDTKTNKWYDITDQKILMVVGPQEADNHVWAKIFGLHPKVNSELVAWAWDDPITLAFPKPDRCKNFVTLCSIPYVYKGGHRVPPILEFIRMVSEVHHVKPIIAVPSRDKDIIELQQERVHGKITLNDAHRAIDEISNGYPDLHIHFLSYESLHLWRKHYLKSLNDEMEFPIAWWDDKNIDKILKPMELL
jgi:hypothetical protein